MTHPALRYIRRTLAVALGVTGLFGCDQGPAEGPVNPRAAACDDGEVLVDGDGQPTGYVRCPDEAIDRVGPAACPPVARYAACNGGVGTCAEDADCTAGPGGVCGSRDPVFGECGCIYPCHSDADCAPDQACVCDTTHGSRCAPADCRGPEDCGGRRCGVADFLAGHSCNHDAALTCRTAQDDCAGNAACDNGSDCWPSGAGRHEGDDGGWFCSGPQEVCGRPLRIAGSARLAGDAGRSDWQARLASTPIPRAHLATHWAAVAALEHASVASFARFSLQLLALGAPCDLVADCQRAAADEVEHAQLAYGIASAFAGEAIGPGPLRLDDMTLETDPATVLREVIIEGCIGETLGAVEAAEAARTIGDPAIATACARIADDELRHAALGWRTARWLLACHPELAAMARHAFSDGIQHHTDGIQPSVDAIMNHGIAIRPDARRAAVAEVIRPLAAHLLAG